MDPGAREVTVAGAPVELTHRLAASDHAAHLPPTGPGDAMDHVAWSPQQSPLP